MTDSLLPKNVSDMEHRLEQAISRISDIGLTHETFWDPWRCPESILPFLAWALSVDLWETTWDTETKRAVIAESLNVHRTKGTRKALNDAINAYGLKIKIREWFEYQPEKTPGTFDVSLCANSKLGYLDEMLYQQITRTINAVKNARSHYTLAVYGQCQKEIGIYGVISGISLLSIGARLQSPLEKESIISHMRSAIICSGMMVLRINARLQ